MIYLTDDAATLEKLRSCRLPAYLLDGDMPDLRDVDIVVVSKNGNAKKLALGLVERGVPAWRMSYIVSDGKSPLQALIGSPKHLFWDDARPLSEAPDNPSLTTYRCGIPGMETNIKWRIPELVITAGPYFSGKSLLAQLLAMNFIAVNGDNEWGDAYDEHGEFLPKLHGASALLCSWEDMPARMRSIAGKVATIHGLEPKMLQDRVHYVCRDPNEDRLIAWFVDLVRYYHKRFQTKYYVLDPWNEVDHLKDMRQLETDYVRDMMKAFRRLVDELGVILNIVTHVPAQKIRGNGRIEPFRLAHAFGSSQFANKADRGLCVARSKTLVHGGDHMVLSYDKIKIEPDMGKTGLSAFKYNLETCGLKFEREASEVLREEWQRA